MLNKKYSFLKPIKNPNLARIGRNEDGGYVVDFEIIKKCNTLITFGLGPDWSFELDYIKKNKNLEIYLYDHTVSRVPYVKDVWKYFRRFITFRATYKAVSSRVGYLNSYRKFLNLKNVNFFKEKITDTSKFEKTPRSHIDAPDVRGIGAHVKATAETNLDKVFSRINSQEEVVLKSDIEGSEYEIIDQILKYSNRIKMSIIEFHWLDKKEEIFLESIKKLKDYFEIIHIHGNNHYPKLDSGLPIILEITFLNKKYIEGKKVEYINKFPVKDLDYPCNPYKEDLTFSFE